MGWPLRSQLGLDKYGWSWVVMTLDEFGKDCYLLVDASMDLVLCGFC